MSNNGHDGKAAFSSWLVETGLPGGVAPKLGEAQPGSKLLPDRPSKEEEPGKLVVAFDEKGDIVLPGELKKRKPFGGIYDDGFIDQYNGDLNLAIKADQVVIKDNVAWLTHKGRRELFGVAGEVPTPPPTVEASTRRAVPRVELRSRKTIDELIKPFEKILQQAGLSLKVKVERGNKRYTHKLILREGGGGEAVFGINIEYPKKGLTELQTYLAYHHNVDIELL